MALNHEPLFIGATRPAMMFGVTMNFFTANVMISALTYLIAKNPLYLLMIVPLHGIAWGLCKNEPRMLSLVGLWAKTKGACFNRRFWKASSYHPFASRRKDPHLEWVWQLLGL